MKAKLALIDNWWTCRYLLEILDEDPFCPICEKRMVFTHPIDGALYTNPGPSPNSFYPIMQFTIPELPFFCYAVPIIMGKEFTWVCSPRCQELIKIVGYV